MNDDGGPEGTEGDWDNIVGGKNKELAVSFAELSSSTSTSLPKQWVNSQK